MSRFRSAIQHPGGRLLLSLALFMVFLLVGQTLLSSLARNGHGGDAALAALGALLVVGGVIEDRSPSALGFPGHRATSALLLGLSIGAGLMSSVIALLWACGHYQIE